MIFKDAFTQGQNKRKTYLIEHLPANLFISLGSCRILLAMVLEHSD